MALTRSLLRITWHSDIPHASVHWLWWRRMIS